MAELDRQLWLNSTGTYGWLDQQLWLNSTGSYG
jgi:hypothetical protein